MALSLPEFSCTEDAVAFGQHITRDQFIFLSGARAALQREFSQLDYDILNLPEESMADIQLRADLACKLQLIREALDVAPDYVLASMIGILAGADEDFALRHATPPAARGFQMAGTGV
jgi:hypothetical protein